ncbi:hypothetical protein E2C01_042733 [Portunus trituberculatus]|uniref:Uncharacterized protein n=1 Tax=Portunus trituberculatus TaxID=210409 RepID=A0A5B7FTU1_PORTR|nr:hypothetical protein [Portunus trituberculatus]
MKEILKLNRSDRVKKEQKQKETKVWEGDPLQDNKDKLQVRKTLGKEAPGNKSRETFTEWTKTVILKCQTLSQCWYHLHAK